MTTKGDQMRTSLFALVFSLFVVGTVFITPIRSYSQNINSAPEFGELKELSSAKRLYVYADDLDVRNLILIEIRKSSKFEIVGKIEDADFFIFYGTSFYRNGSTSFGGIFGHIMISATVEDVREAADYYVLRRGDRIAENVWRPRIIWGKKNVTVMHPNPFVKVKVPATELTKKFMKELEIASGSGHNSEKT